MRPLRTVVRLSRMIPVSTWTVTCESCNHSWPLVGNWSEYERQSIESRPCPECDAYTLCSPEPEPKPYRVDISSSPSTRLYKARWKRIAG